MNLNREPVAIQAVILAGLNLLVVLGILHLTDVQLGAVNAFLAALLGLLVRHKVEPLEVPARVERQQRPA